jgi:hypothetical protein
VTKPQLDQWDEAMLSLATIGDEIGNDWLKQYWLVVWNMTFIFPFIGKNNPN